MSKKIKTVVLRMLNFFFLMFSASSYAVNESYFLVQPVFSVFDSGGESETLCWTPEPLCFGSCMSKSRGNGAGHSSSSSSSKSSVSHPPGSSGVQRVSLISAGGGPPDDDKPEDYEKRPGEHYVDYEPDPELQSGQYVIGIQAAKWQVSHRRTLRILVGPKDNPNAEETEVLQEAEEYGVPVVRTSDAALSRIDASRQGVRLFGQLGPQIHSLESLFQWVHHTTLPVIWGLVGVQYGGNVGSVIRTAEVSGAAGVIVCQRVDRALKTKASYASLGTQYFIPVLYEAGNPESVVRSASAAGLNTIALETSGTELPWAINWRVPSLVIVGGERGGIPSSVIAQCNAIVLIPAFGITSSYNLHGAMSFLTCEIMRQHFSE